MNAPWPPYPPGSPPPPGISVNGPGIHIHTHTTGPGYPPAMPHPGHRQTPDHATEFSDQTRTWVANAHRRRGPAVFGLGLGGLAVLMLTMVGWTVMQLPLFFLIGPAFAGVGMLLGAGYFALASKPPAQQLEAKLERRLLALAKAKGGVVTVSDAALHLHVSLAQAEDALGEMLHSGHVDIDNDPETGAVIYVFRDWAKALPAAQR